MALPPRQIRSSPPGQAGLPGDREADVCAGPRASTSGERREQACTPLGHGRVWSQIFKARPPAQPGGGSRGAPCRGSCEQGKAQAFTSASTCHGGNCLWGRVTLCEVAIPQEGLHQHSSGLTGVRWEWGGQPGDHGEVSTPLEPTARSALEAEASWAE